MSIRIGYSRNAARRIINDLKIKEPPVSVNQIAKHLKLEVWEYDKLPDKISALLIYEKKRIIINPNHAVTRKRFSIAHEIGHFALGHTHDIPEQDDSDMDFIISSHLRKQYSGEQESEASEFAAELLMPFEMLKIYYPAKKDRPSDLAELFNVSEEAMWIRLCKQKMIKY